MKDNFVVTIAGGGSTYTPGIVMMLLENMSRFPLREIRLYDNHHQRQKTIGDACAILVAERFPQVRKRPVACGPTRASSTSAICRWLSRVCSPTSSACRRAKR